MLNIYIPGHPVKNKKHPDGCLKKHVCREKTFGTNKKTHPGSDVHKTV